MAYEDYEATQSNTVGEFIEDKFNAICGALDSNAHIHSTGSNSNGNWVKLSNGTLIQWGRTANMSITLHSGYAEAGDINFPISFAAAPPVVQLERVHTTGTWLIAAAVRGTITASKIPLGFGSIGGSDTTNTVAVAWMAIGTWS